MNVSDPVPFKLGKAAPANTYLAIWMAEDAGFYGNQGLKLEIFPMVGGSKAGPTLVSGRIDLMHIGMSSVVRANATGDDLVVIGSLSNVIRGTLFAAPGVTNLKGGIIGVSSTGSESDATAVRAINRLGLTRDDITLKEIGVERLSALRDGTVSAAMLDEPRRSEALKSGLTAMVDLLSERIPWIYSGLVVTRSYLAGNQDSIAKFMRATIEGNYLAISDEPRGKAVLAREMDLSNSEDIDIAYNNFRSLSPLNAELDVEGAENVIATVAPVGETEDYLDNCVLDRLSAEGFFTAMEQKYGVGAGRPSQ
jgi:ABC-type nitrate/sulfonate/bicarbonate transport system substrate-binding protein